MKKVAIAAAALMLAGCASAPKPSITHNAPSIAHKTAKAAPVEQSTPNQIVKKRWFPKFKVKWLHPK